jgi:hypothetical protein
MEPISHPAGSMPEKVVMTDLGGDVYPRMRYPRWNSLVYEDWDEVISIRHGAQNGAGWCGFCKAMPVTVCSEGCVGYGGLWCGGGSRIYWWSTLGPCVPVSMDLCGQSCRTRRLLDAIYLRQFTAKVVRQTEKPPCSWCGYGAGSWCEACDWEAGPAIALCHLCDASLGACRKCFAMHYVRGAAQPMERPSDASRRSSGTLLETCVVCEETRSTKRCGGCHTMHYCSAKCQKKDWRQHKLVCGMLQGPIAVHFVYDWHVPEIASCRDWASANGAAAERRFYACFLDGFDT